MKEIRRLTADRLRGLLYRGNNFLASREDKLVNRAIDSPQEQREELIRREIARIQGRMMKMGDSLGTAYFYHYQLGRCYKALEQRAEALDHFEEGVLRHSRQSLTEDFNIYVDGYLAGLREFLQKDAIPSLQGANRLIGVRRLEHAIGSTSRVLGQFPELEEVGREKYLAGMWLARVTGRNLRDIGRSKP